MRYFPAPSRLLNMLYVSAKKMNKRAWTTYMRPSKKESARSSTIRKIGFLLKRRTPPGPKIIDPSMSLGVCQPKITRGSAITTMVQRKQKNPIARFSKKMTVAMLKNRVALSLGNDPGRSLSQKAFHVGSTTFNGSV